MTRRRYLTICFIGIPFITAYSIISSIFRGLGDSKSPMYFVAVACVVNIGLDYRRFVSAFVFADITFRRWSNIEGWNGLYRSTTFRPMAFPAK